MSDRDGPRTGTAGAGGTGEDVGSVAEEAARLVEALQGWARSEGAHQAGAAGAAAAGVAAGLREVNEHLATGGAECRYCPLCRVIGSVRAVSPEVREHLGSAASSLMQAAAAALATPVHEPGRPRRGGAAGPGVERIDLDDPEAPDEHGDPARPADPRPSP